MYTLIIFTLDILACLENWIRRIIPSAGPRHTASDIDHLSDAELLELRKTPRGFAPSPTPFGAHNISRVTEHTVFKAAQDVEEEVEYPSEALVLQLVAEQTTIPVPRVRRIVKDGYWTFTAMEYIPGRQLSSASPSLSLLQRLRVVFTLRSYVRQLRAIRHPRSSVPGPLGKANEGPKICQSPLFGKVIETRGPFATYSLLTAFFNDRLVRALKSTGAASQPRETDTSTFDDSQPLVLTHQDLNPRNLIVDNDGHLWLVDWAWAGFYPPWWEFAAMRRQAENEELVMERKEPFWDAMIPFVCGTYFKQEAWLGRMAIALDWK